jgi:hypothetical protein
MSSTDENASLSDLIRDVLLAMVSSQNEANKSFVTAIEELAATNLTIGYTKNAEGRAENREISGNALAFGVLPTLLSIQSSTVEIRTALSTTKNTSSNTAAKNVGDQAGYRFKTNTVDAKYQNTYNYKAEYSSLIRLTIVPTPPSTELLDAIKALTKTTPITDKPKS